MSDPTWEPLDQALAAHERTAEIQARLDAATPGPWHKGAPKFTCSTHPPGRHFPRSECVFERDGWWEDKDVYRDIPYEWRGERGPIPDGMIVGMWDYDDGGIGTEADAEFIAHAPEDMQRLLDRVAELEAMVIAHHDIHWLYDGLGVARMNIGQPCQICARAREPR